MKFKKRATKINFIFISISQILGSVGPVKQLIKLVPPKGKKRKVKKRKCLYVPKKYVSEFETKANIYAIFSMQKTH